MSGKKKGIVIAVIALVLVAAGMMLLYVKFRPKAQKGSKTVTLLVVDDHEAEKEYVVHTDAEYLKGAMEEAKGFSFAGDNSQYGLYLTEVNGLRAVYETDGAYWSILVNGEYGMYGADAQVIADGDTFTFVYTKAE